MSEEEFSEIECPLCKEKIESKKPKTLRQWKPSLVVHLIVAPRHHLDAEEAEEVANKYFRRIRYFFKLNEERLKEKQ